MLSTYILFLFLFLFLFLSIFFFVLAGRSRRLGAGVRAKIDSWRLLTGLITLSDDALNKDYLASIRAAATLGKNTLNRYYNRTDESEVYRIAMSTSRYYLSLS